MTIFYFTLKRIFSNMTNIVILLLFPVIFIFFPAADEWPFLPYGYQYFGILLLFVGIRLTTILMEDRKKGLIKKLSVTPISHLNYLVQNLLAFTVILIIQCIIMVFGGLLIGHELYKPFWLLLLFVCFSITSMSMALGWITFFTRKDVSFLTYMSLIFLMIILGGLMIPVQIFPEILRNLAYIFPTYWLAEGMEWIRWGDEIGDILLINGVLLLYGIIFIIIGSSKKLS